MEKLILKQCYVTSRGMAYKSNGRFRYEIYDGNIRLCSFHRNRRFVAGWVYQSVLTGKFEVKLFYGRLGLVDQNRPPAFPGYQVIGLAELKPVFSLIN